jgi:hypothetical protein
VALVVIEVRGYGFKWEVRPGIGEKGTSEGVKN